MMGITQSGDADYTKEVKSQSPLDTIVTGKRFHDDILEYVRVCKPDEIVIIFDADCKQMGSWDKEAQPDKDLGKRFLDFSMLCATYGSMPKEWCAMYILPT